MKCYYCKQETEKITESPYTHEDHPNVEFTSIVEYCKPCEATYSMVVAKPKTHK